MPATRLAGLILAVMLAATLTVAVAGALAPAGSGAAPWLTGALLIAAMALRVIVGRGRDGR